MTTNTPMVVWKASKHPEICKAFMKTLYEEDTYVEFLHATPVGMLPAIKGIADTDAYKDDETIKQFAHAEEVLTVLKKVSRRNYVEKMWNLDKNETLEGGNHAE